MTFNQTYINILFESKLADKVNEDFYKACNYFLFLSEKQQDVFEWSKSNNTKFELNIINNYQNIQLILNYNNNLIKKQIIIVDLNNFGQKFLSNKIRIFLNSFNKKSLLSKIDNKLDIDKFLNAVKE